MIQADGGQPDAGAARTARRTGALSGLKILDVSGWSGQCCG